MLTLQKEKEKKITLNEMARHSVAWCDECEWNVFFLCEMRFFPSFGSIMASAFEDQIQCFRKQSKWISNGSLFVHCLEGFGAGAKIPIPKIVFFSRLDAYGSPPKAPK